MKNVFIAVGGSGAKVAEALVRLLGVGFPTHRDEHGTWTSAGRSLQIWRVDPDGSSGAAASLQQCVDQYNALQQKLGGDGNDGGSRWAMEIAPRVRHMNPLELPSVGFGDNHAPTLRGILDSNYSSARGRVNSSDAILSSFYEAKDLDVEIDRGFYQKPFIGAAVMAAYAESLQDTNSPGGKACNLAAFNNNETNFFLCGSLHGGTGACGVPVMGRYLNSQKQQNDEWRIGACLLTPYSRPPQPPFRPLPEGHTISERDLANLLRVHAEHPAFKELGTDEQKEKLARQILDGFFADPEATEQRARQGLAYYRDHAADYFDELYIVGKPEPDTLTLWSNGGSSQRNPPNSAETVAALAALNFFSQAKTGDEDSYIIGTTPGNLAAGAMRLRNLPSYKVAEADVEAEKVFLATAAATFLLLNAIPWGKAVGSWGKECPALHAHYDGNDQQKNEDLNHFTNAAVLLASFALATLDRSQTVGWDGDDAAELLPYFASPQLLRRAQAMKDEAAALQPYLATSPKVQDAILKSVQKSLMSSEAKDILRLGESALKLTTFDFNKMCTLDKGFTRGEYLRHMWSHMFARCRDRNQFAR
jgi:hypothetical protein